MSMWNHPAYVNEQARQIIETSATGGAAYGRLQAEGSAWSRGTPYGDIAAEYALEAASWFARECGPSAVVCCAGCNDGLEMETFERAGLTVKGFDLDPEKVRVAAACGLDARVGDIHAPPYEPGTFDAGFCSHTLEHCVDREKAVLALLRLVKPRGLVFIAVPIDKGQPYYNPSHTGWFESRAQVEALFAGAAVLYVDTRMKSDEQLVLVARRAP